MKAQQISLYPTGTCFDDAMNIIGQVVSKDPCEGHKRRHVLTHGICYLDGHPFSHAWIEVTDGSILGMHLHRGERILVKRPAKEFYAQLSPRDVTRYSICAAFWRNLITETFGPWEERYLKGCKDFKESNLLPCALKFKFSRQKKILKGIKRIAVGCLCPLAQKGLWWVNAC